MSLERYVENSWLRREPTSPQEIADQLGIVARCINDSAVESISDDLRFYTTFNAVLALANTALRASGYRTTNQQGAPYSHHRDARIHDWCRCQADPQAASLLKEAKRG